MPGLSAAFDRIGSALEHHVANSHAAGAALAVTDREEILGVAVRGVADAAAGTPVRPETRFQIGSISKSFAAIVVLQELEAGRLDLHTSVNTILPWLRLPEPFGPITLHHLMTHTAGLATGSEDAPTLLGALLLQRELSATTAPGERFWYSNDGWKIVGACLERVTGTPIHDLIHQRILEPVGMHHSVARITDAERQDIATGYEPMMSDRPPQLRHPLAPATWTVTDTADGSIISNVLDMSSYARLLLARGDVPDGHGGRVLSEPMFATLTTPVIEDEEDGRYAYGLREREVDGRRWVTHTGGMVGYTALLAVSPDDGLGIVVLQNGAGNKLGVAAHALATVRASLEGRELPDIWAPPAPTDIPGGADYVGAYVGDDGRRMTAEAEADGVRITVGTVSARLERDPLEPEVGDGFLIAHPALDRFRLEFVRDPQGRVVEAFHGGTCFVPEGTSAEAHRLPEPWRGYPGSYRNDDPWGPLLLILGRKGRLVLQWPAGPGDEQEDGTLVPLGDGTFAVGDVSDPRRIRFEGDVEGRAVVAVYNAGRWYRGS